MPINLFALSGLLTAITSGSLGLFVYLKHRRSISNFIWALFAFAVALWGIGVFKIATTTDVSRALLWWRVTHIGVILIPVLFFHFIYKFLDLKKRRTLATIYVIGIGFLLLNATDLFIRDMRFVFSTFYYDSPPGPVYPYFVLFFFGTITYSHYELAKAFKGSSGTRKNQIKYFFLATAIGFSGGGTCFLPVFGIDIYPVLNFTVVLYPVIMTYAIVRYRLMDIAVVVNKTVAYVAVLCLIFVPAYLFAMLGQRATLYAIPPFITATLVFACGLWVVFKNHRSTKNVIFGLICFAVSTWLFSSFMMYSATTPEQALYWGRLKHIGIVFIPALFFHFTAHLLRQSTPHVVFLHYCLSFTFLSLIPSPYFLEGQYFYFWGYYPRAGSLYLVFLLYFALSVGWSFSKLYVGYKSIEDKIPFEAIRLRQIAVAFVLGYGSAVDFAQLYGYEFYPVGHAFALMWIAAITYSIHKHGILDVSFGPSPAVQKYLQPLGVVAGAYIVVLLLIKIFTGSPQYLLAALIVATLSLVSGLFADLQRGIEKVIGRALFPAQHDAYETLTEFSKSLVTILDIRSLSEEIIRTLVNVIGVNSASLYLFDTEQQVYVLASSHNVKPLDGSTEKLASRDPLPHHLAYTQAILVGEELEQTGRNGLLAPVARTLQNLHSEACIPFVNKDRLIGFCSLGPRRGNAMYSQEEIGLLTTLAQNAAIALDNAMLYEDLKRSQILMRRTDRLRSLETIAGGFAHEIRNPLTSIKTFVQLAPDRKDDPEFIGHFSQVVSEDVDRIERLIQEILDYARYMEPKFTEEDLNDVVASCLYFIEVKADSKSIQIEKVLASDLPTVMLDRQQIKQVLLNLFLNAMDAMAEKGGRLTVRTHRLTKSGASWVQIEVTDSGSGISPSDLEHIFDPFYTTKHESGEREGTGLGLTIVHQIVQEHYGYIEVKSQVGSGTTFYVNLPVNSPAHHVAREQEEHEKTSPIGR
jgi:two-component system NtrC family sensor kinase